MKRRNTADQRVRAIASRQQGTDREVDPEELAKRVRTTYIRERRMFEERVHLQPSRYTPAPRWDAGVNRNGSRRESIWLRVARKLSSKGWDPEDYIRRVFDSQRPDRMLYPNQLVSQDCLERYVESRQEKRRQIRIDFESQTEALQDTLFDYEDVQGDELSPSAAAEAVREILLDETDRSITPWFRYCMAQRLGFADVADRYREIAAWTYWRYHEDFDAVCGDFIPKSLKRQARQLHDRFLVRLGLDDASL